MQNKRTGLRSQGTRGAVESLRERGPPPKHLQGNENMGRGSSMAVVRQSVAGGDVAPDGGGGVTIKKGDKKSEQDAPSLLSSETYVDNPAPPAPADVHSDPAAADAHPAADGVRHQPPPAHIHASRISILSARLAAYAHCPPCGHTGPRVGHNLARLARLHVLRLLSFPLRPKPWRR